MPASAGQVALVAGSERDARQTYRVDARVLAPPEQTPALQNDLHNALKKALPDLRNGRFSITKIEAGSRRGRHGDRLPGRDSPLAVHLRKTSHGKRSPTFAHLFLCATIKSSGIHRPVHPPQGLILTRTFWSVALFGLCAIACVMHLRAAQIPGQQPPNRSWR